MKYPSDSKTNVVFILYITLFLQKKIHYNKINSYSKLKSGMPKIITLKKIQK